MTSQNGFNISLRKGSPKNFPTYMPNAVNIAQRTRMSCHLFDDLRL